MSYQVGQHNPTLSIELKGGFGNQLFQFSTVLAAALQSEACFRLSYAKGSRNFSLGPLGLSLGTRYFPTISDGKLEIKKVARSYIFRAKEFREQSFNFGPIPVFTENTQLHGYFQSFKYFDHIRLELADWIISHLPEVTYGYIPEFMIHVRLGDIARNQHFRDFHGVVSSGYFIRAIESFEVGESTICAITDDLEMFPREHRDLIKNFPQIQVSSGSLLSDFTLLTKSKRLVISNSTFSWWAAYLSSASVVAPRQWFANSDQTIRPENFYPDNWRIIQ